MNIVLEEIKNKLLELEKTMVLNMDSLSKDQLSSFKEIIEHISKVLESKKIDQFLGSNYICMLDNAIMVAGGNMIGKRNSR